jgi:hypothetical protein
MRLKKLLAVWLLAVALPAAAADVSFTARLQSYTSTPASSYLMAVLTNCAAGNIPRVISTGVKAIDRQRFDPDATGLISATITPKGDITCGSQIGLTQYRLEIWEKQYGQPDRRVWYATYDIASAFDLSTAVPASPVNTSANPQWLDLPLIATPNGPAPNFARIFGSSSSNLQACLLSDLSNCAPSGGGGGFYQTFMNAASLLTQRARANFFNGITCADNAVPSPARTDCQPDYGTTAGKVAQGNDSRIVGAEQAANKDAVSGYAGLDGGTKLKCSEFPTLTGDVSNANCAVTLTKALFYQTLQANGGAVTQRATANFSTEFTVADNAGQSRTDISVNAIAENKVTSLVADLAAKEATANKNQANGYAGLDAGTKLAAAQLPNPAASTLGGVMSKTCTSTDKISAIGNDGIPVCSADQTGGAGGGITTLDTLNAATQTFGVTNDTNVTMTITPSGANHQFAMLWAGALAKARQHAATVYNDQSNAFTTGTQDFSAATMVKLRVAGGLTTSANGDIGYDSTGLRWHAWINGADRKFIGATNDGGAGQPCLSNADGTCTFADPITSGNQGAATTQTITATGALTGVTVTNIGTVLITVSGTYAGVAFNFEGTPDGTFTPAFLLNASQLDAASIVTATGALPSNSTRAWLVDAAGMTKIRLNATAWTSGTANITVTPVYHQFVPWTHVDGTISANLNAGANVVGKVGIDQTTPGTTNGVQVNAALPAGANRIGKTTVRNSADSADIDPLADATFTGRINTQGQKTMAASTPVVLPSDQAAIPVTVSGVATSANQTNGTQQTQITDGVNGVAAVKAASTAAVAADKSIVVAVSPNSPLPTGVNRIGKTTIRNSADSADIDPLADATFTGRINTQGQKTMAASTPVVLPSDQVVPVQGASADNSANSSAKQPVLPAIAKSANPSWTDGNQVPLIVDPATGGLKVSGLSSGVEQVNNSSGSAANVGYNAGSLPVPVNDPATVQMANVMLALMSNPLYARRILGSFGRAITSTDDALDVNVKNSVAGCAGFSSIATNTTPFNISTATTALVIPKSSSDWTYICAAEVVVAGADNVALIYGTTSSTPCDTGATGISGGATAATGWNFAANGGKTYGNGAGILYRVPPGKDVCLQTSAAVQASGSFTWTQQ